MFIHKNLSWESRHVLGQMLTAVERATRKNKCDSFWCFMHDHNVRHEVIKAMKRTIERLIDQGVVRPDGFPKK